MKPAILIASGPWPAEPWAEPIRRTDPERPIHIWPDLPDPAAIRYALVWKPPQGLLATLPDLAAIFSLGAGVDHFIFQGDLPEVPIVRVVSPDLTQRMTEWVTLQVLIHHRQSSPAGPAGRPPCRGSPPSTAPASSIDSSPAPISWFASCR